MRRSGLLIACVLLVSPLTGCVFFHDRALDFADILGVKIVAGRGFKVGVGVYPGITPILPETLLLMPPLGQTGLDETYSGLYFGYYDFHKYGFQGRSAGIWQENGWEIALPIDHHIEPLFGNAYLFDSTLDYQDRDIYVLEGKTYDHVLSYPQSRFHSYFDIQVTFMPMFAGLEVNLSPFQLVDFLLGWMYIDIADDDTRNYTPIGRREEP